MHAILAASHIGTGMIPPFSASMVLPPFTGDDPGAKARMSPYKVDMLSIVRRFATSTVRIALLRGLLSYREQLLIAGINDGFQWIDGSFVEDIEVARGRAPSDIDLVTFATPPAAALPGASDKEYVAWTKTFGHLFDPVLARQQFGCEAFFVSLHIRPALIVDDTRYWFGLFSHQRQTSLWKGMIQVPLLSNDMEAQTYLNQSGFTGSENRDA
jgi:hypothetical protein